MEPDEALPAPRSAVEIRQSIDDARQESTAARPEDGPYAELMATCTELGELLESGRTDEKYEQECRALVDRLVVLGNAGERHWEQRWAAWAAENTTFGGDVW